MEAAPRQRELLLASEFVVVEAGQHGTVTLIAPEPGLVDLSRLLLMAARTTDIADFGDSLDLLPQFLVESILFGNTERLLRGSSNSIAAPGGVFSPLRQFSPILLGQRPVERGDFLQIKGSITDTAVDAWNMTAAAPFLPMRLSADPGAVPSLTGPHLYVASASATAAFEATATLRLVMEADGYLDISSLQLQAALVAAVADFDQNVVGSVVVQSIELPTGEELVVGLSATGTLSAPGASFAAMGRANGWVNFGRIQVSEGDELVVVVENRADPAGSVLARITAGARFYPLQCPV